MAARSKYSLRPLEHWDRRFESCSRHGCVSMFLCVCVLLCVGRSLGAGLIPRPGSPTKCLKGSISKENPTPEKGIRNNEKENVSTRKLLLFLLLYQCLCSLSFLS
jgi:hypothetical protein